jgi:hypothetical protein
MVHKGGSMEASAEFLKRDRRMYEELVAAAGVKFPDN